MDLIEKLNWRYAAKRMTGNKVPQDKLDRVLEAIRLAPSSGGFQPYKIVVVENEDIKKKLQPAANGQAQITEASHLLVFAAWDNITEEKISEYIQLIADTREITVDSLAVFKTRMMGLAARTADQNFNWAARQAYIALGVAIIAAALEGLDATPMEGFTPEAFDEILELKEKGLRSVVLLAIGYRDEENDMTVKSKKVRRSKEQLFINN